MFGSVDPNTALKLPHASPKVFGLHQGELRVRSGYIRVNVNAKVAVKSKKQTRWSDERPRLNKSDRNWPSSSKHVRAEGVYS